MDDTVPWYDEQMCSHRWFLFKMVMYKTNQSKLEFNSQPNPIDMAKLPLSLHFLREFSPQKDWQWLLVTQKHNTSSFDCVFSFATAVFFFFFASFVAQSVVILKKLKDKQAPSSHSPIRCKSGSCCSAWKSHWGQVDKRDHFCIDFHFQSQILHQV